jgi:hypothetical protein
MRAVGLKVLKNKLSEYVRLAAGGETVLSPVSKKYSKACSRIALTVDLPRHFRRTRTFARRRSIAARFTLGRITRLQSAPRI